MVLSAKGTKYPETNTLPKHLFANVYKSRHLFANVYKSRHLFANVYKCIHIAISMVSTILIAKFPPKRLKTEILRFWRKVTTCMAGIIPPFERESTVLLSSFYCTFGYFLFSFWLLYWGFLDLFWIFWRFLLDFWLLFIPPLATFYSRRRQKTTILHSDAQ